MFEFQTTILTASLGCAFWSLTSPSDALLFFDKLETVLYWRVIEMAKILHATVKWELKLLLFFFNIYHLCIDRVHLMVTHTSISSSIVLHDDSSLMSFFAALRSFLSLWCLPPSPDRTADSLKFFCNCVFLFVLIGLLLSKIKNEIYSNQF